MAARESWRCTSPTASSALCAVYLLVLALYTLSHTHARCRRRHHRAAQLSARGAFEFGAVVRLCLGLARVCLSRFVGYSAFAGCTGIVRAALSKPPDRLRADAC